MHNLPQRNSFVVLILLPRAEALGLQLPERPDCPFQTTGSFGFKGRFEERKGEKKKRQRKKGNTPPPPSEQSSWERSVCF